MIKRLESYPEKFDEVSNTDFDEAMINKNDNLSTMKILRQNSQRSEKWEDFVSDMIQNHSQHKENMDFYQETMVEHLPKFSVAAKKPVAWNKISKIMEQHVIIWINLSKELITSFFRKCVLC
jgi:predicted transcriptional regulator